MEEFLKLLYRSKPKYRKKLIESAPNEVIHLISQCALNILSGEVVLTKKQKVALRPHKKALHQLARGPVKHKKKILQKGGFPPLLLALLSPILGAAAAAIINRILPKRD